MAATSDDIFRRALTTFQAGQLSDAERLFKTILQIQKARVGSRMELQRLQPGHVAALNLLSMLLTQLERYGEAEGYIRQQLRTDPQSSASSGRRF